MRGIVLCALIFSSYSTGCSTKETDPGRVSTGDLLWGYDRLQSYLKQRRLENDYILQKTLAIEQSIFVQKRELESLGVQVDSARRGLNKNSLELVRLTKEISEKEVELAALNERVVKLKAEVKSAQEVLAKSKIGDDERGRMDVQIASQRKEISDLERSISLVQSSIERSIRTRIDQSLRERQ